MPRLRVIYVSRAVTAFVSCFLPFRPFHSVAFTCFVFSFIPLLSLPSCLAYSWLNWLSFTRFLLLTILPFLHVFACLVLLYLAIHRLRFLSCFGLKYRAFACLVSLLFHSCLLCLAIPCLRLPYLSLHCHPLPSLAWSFSALPSLVFACLVVFCLAINLP